MKFIEFLVAIAALAAAGYLVFYYLEGFDVAAVFNQSNHPFQIPDQSQYAQDPSYQLIQSFLSRRWSVDSPGINILVSKSLNPNDLNSTDRIFEVIDTNSLNSAYLVLINSSGGGAQYQDSALAKQGNLYLLNEFIPLDGRQKTFARVFYEESDALIVAKTMDYPVIKDINVSQSGEGTIQAVGKDAQYRFPIKWGFIFKRLGSFVSY